jgi:hypothetical protein
MFVLGTGFDRDPLAPVGVEKIPSMMKARKREDFRRSALRAQTLVGVRYRAGRLETVRTAFPATQAVTRCRINDTIDEISR